MAQGIGWDPEIRGILAVLVGVVVLCGSVYLLLATNVGARLGMLIALCALFGFMAILSLYFWLNPPGIGPRGDDPFWQAEEVYVTGGPEPPILSDAQMLPEPDERITPEEALAEAPDLAQELPEDPVLSDIAGVDDEVLPPPEDFGGWRITSTADAGEAQGAADEALLDQGVFEDITEYQHGNVFGIGGKPTSDEACDEDDAWIALNLCRAWHRVTEPFETHPSHYAVVEVQGVVPQEVQPGEAPPTPIIDEEQPAVWVVMERQLGTTRLLPFTFFVISFAGFLFFAVILHFREKTLERNLEEAAQVAEART